MKINIAEFVLLFILLFCLYFEGLESGLKSFCFVHSPSIQFNGLWHSQQIEEDNFNSKMSSPTKPATSSTACIEDLPWEMINELFEHLAPRDLAACSMVNKRWHSIYAGFKVQHLVATDCCVHYDPSRWYNSNRQIQANDRWHPAIFRRLADKPLFSNLKRLALCGYEPGFDLNEFNRFSQLVHLEINILHLGKKKVHLNLPRLRVLAFHTANDHCPLTIDCPKLSTLRYYLYRSEEQPNSLMDVKQPETIQKLETNLFGPNLAPFKSVECLVTEEFRAISEATLLSLPSLRELRYIHDIERLNLREFNDAPGSIDRMKRMLSKFLDEAKRLRGSDFQFICSGFRLSKVNVDQIDFGVQVDERTRDESLCREYVYLKNYHLIEPGALHFVDRIDYIRLSSVAAELPPCFSQKFVGIKCVVATSEVQDADHFLWFLKSLKSLNCLELEGTGLNQTFYDQLPASAQSLLSFELRGDWKNDFKMNFDFIGVISRLSSLMISQSSVSFESLTSLVKSLGSVNLVKCSFEVRFKRECFKVYKGITEWKICKAYQLLLATENPEKIVNFFEGL